MGFLDKLWDETLAGPMPESGLGKLRKYDSFPAGGSGSTSPMISPPAAAVLPHHHEGMPITRSITIIRTNSNFKNNLSVDAAPESPCTPGTPGGEFKRFARRNAFDRADQSKRF